jgi:hypothetical protein
VRETIVHCPDTEYDADEAARVIADIEGGDLPLVISDEVLSGIGFASFGRRTVGPVGVINRLRRLFGEGLTVLMVTRPPVELLRSYHRQLLAGGYHFSYRTFLSHQLEAGSAGLLPALRFAAIETFMAGAGIAFRSIHAGELVADESRRATFLAGIGDAGQGGFPHRNTAISDEAALQMLQRNNRDLHGVALSAPLHLHMQHLQEMQAPQMPASLFEAPEQEAAIARYFSSPVRARPPQTGAR